MIYLLHPFGTIQNGTFLDMKLFKNSFDTEDITALFSLETVSLLQRKEFSTVVTSEIPSTEGTTEAERTTTPLITTTEEVKPSEKTLKDDGFFFLLL